MAKSKVTAATILGRITYTSIYVFLCFILAVLLLIVPADIVRQVLGHTFQQQTNVLILAIVYVLTLIIVLFVYALRLYTNRTVLASIPKPWIPVEKGDVNKPVRAMIVASLGRSAAIAWEARPKVITPKAETREWLDTIPEGTTDTTAEAGAMAGGQHQEHEGKSGSSRGILKFCGSFGRKKEKKTRIPRTTTAEDQMGIALPPIRPVWGHIEHDGWESPNSPDLPDLQYATVLAELPNLIEAKAVSLAPLDPQFIGSASPQPILDPDAVALLQRAPNMSMRDYVNHLVNLGILSLAGAGVLDYDQGGDSHSHKEQPLVVSEFLDVYERARFSTKPMSKVLFRNLMHLFAEVLRAMQPLDPAILDGDDGGFEDGYSGKLLYDGDGVSVSESDGQHIDDDAPRDGTPTTPARSLSLSSSVFSRSIRRGGDGNSVRSTASSSYSQQQRRLRQPRPPTRQHTQQRHHHHHHQQQQQQQGHAKDRDRDRDRASSSTNTWQQQQQRYRTAPTTPMGRKFGGDGNGRGNDAASSIMSHHSGRSSESVDTFARTRRPYPASASSSQLSNSASGASLRSFSSSRSRASGSQNSVIIRLARPEDGDDARGLPYVLRMGGEGR